MMIKTFDQFLLESQQATQKKYEDWEKGVIKAWGQLLYLSYYETPKKLNNLTDLDEFKRTFWSYFFYADQDEDMQDWMGNNPPTFNGGKESLFDQNRLDEVLTSIAKKTPTGTPLIVHRSSEKEQPGWSSFSTRKDEKSYSKGTMRSYTLPKGTPVIWADGIADHDEVIVKLDPKTSI